MSPHGALSTLFPKEEIPLFRDFIFVLRQGDSHHLLRNDIVLRFQDFLKEREEPGKKARAPRVTEFLDRTQEMLLFEEFTVCQHRRRPGFYQFLRIDVGGDYVDTLTSEKFLDFREQMAGMPKVEPERKLKLDFKPFYSLGPVIRDLKKIGQGQRFLNSYMAGKLQNEPQTWQAYLCEFLTIHRFHDDQILVDGAIISGHKQLFEAVQKALDHLENLPQEDSLDASKPVLRGLGFRDGFGRTVGGVRHNLQLLSNLLEEPNSDNVESYIATIPMISRVAVISPHGWFGQENVLGRPDTGGQVVYILDQVKALEKYLHESLHQAGLSVEPQILVLTRLIPENEGTTCNQKLEKILGTKNSWILRVPFRDAEANVLPRWISRFHIWPYLEQFALEGKHELISEFGGNPDLIIGNYSDGNLVASLLSSWMGVIQCNIAHALEKSKYLFSELYWQDMEKDYNFSLQFTADLISMNQADNIISSTAQEIAGTDNGMGQYESYSLFSLPGLYEVVNGVPLTHPKFNVVSPGVDESIYFPFREKERRLPHQTGDLAGHLFSNEGSGCFGRLEDPDRTPIFTMARLEIKNLTGLVEAFGQSPELQDLANLVVVTRTLREEGTTDEEERLELKKMYGLIDLYNLYGKIRWVENSSRQNGAEFYRIVADRRGVFVQPALFEAFGLTILEAMFSGLPTFATQFGGPMETIQNGRNGFWINPTQPELLAGPILEFLKRCREDENCWDTISRAGIERVREAYTWELYSEKLLKFARLYGFWNYTDLAEEKKEVAQYCNLLFHLIFKRRVQALEDGGGPTAP
ncbi:MAG: sucrose synthase [Nitrospinaceae bacterium]